MKHFSQKKIVYALLYTSLLLFIQNMSLAQKTPCPLPQLPNGVNCDTPILRGKFYTKNIVTDFKADPSGKTNSHVSFECAARFFNENGGNGKLIIPYGTYKIGLQDFKEPNKSTCSYWTDYGWIGRDLMHIVNCTNLQIVGISNKGKKPLLFYRDSIKVGGFKKNGEISNYKNKTDGRFNMPPNCDESQKYDTYQACSGATFYIDNCTSVTISNIEINGSSDKSTLGSTIGPGPSPYEVWAHGIVIWNAKKIAVKSVNIINMVADGVMIKNYTDDGLETKNYNTVLDKIRIEGSGRNNISWIGGNGLTVSNSQLGGASTGRIKTDPGASLDIEPEIHAKEIDRCHSALVDGKHVIINDYCFNGVFTNNFFFDDRLSSLLNADRIGHSKNIKANNLRISNKNARSYYSVSDNVIDFYKCNLIGKWVIKNIMMPPIKTELKIKKSSFKEK